jgi:hypothetical protein
VKLEGVQGVVVSVGGRLFVSQEDMLPRRLNSSNTPLIHLYCNKCQEQSMSVSHSPQVEVPAVCEVLQHHPFLSTLCFFALGDIAFSMSTSTMSCRDREAFLLATSKSDKATSSTDRRCLNYGPSTSSQSFSGAHLLSWYCQANTEGHINRPIGWH